MKAMLAIFMALLMPTFLFGQSQEEQKKLSDIETSAPDNGPGRVGIGDAYYDASIRFPKDKAKLLEKAVSFYAKAWPDLSDVWKIRMRERFRKMFQTSAPLPIATNPPEGWKNGSCPGAKVGRTFAAAHSGKACLAVACFDRMKPEKYWAVDSPSFPTSPGKVYEFSFWVMTDLTDSTEDAFIVPIFAPGRKLVDQPTFVFKKDTPWWQKVEGTIKVPEGAANFELHLYVESKAGVIFVDDVSLKCDGKELIQGGGFEGR